MNEPVENEYFNWLCEKVLDNQEYVGLMEILFGTEFIPVIYEDSHRHADGLELRHNYLRDRSIARAALNAPVSILEVFIAFADRASFQTDIPAKDWFWRFLSNLGLDTFRHISESDVPVIEEILNTFTWRIYEPNGYGGMFPMADTPNDQREVEIWYQFCEYALHEGLV